MLRPGRTLLSALAAFAATSLVLVAGLPAAAAPAPAAIKPFYGEAAGDQLTSLLRDHILIAADVVARLHKDWAADIAAYGKVHLHILVLADDLTNGIVSQFPDAFADGPLTPAEVGA